MRLHLPVRRRRCGCEREPVLGSRSHRPPCDEAPTAEMRRAPPRGSARATRDLNKMQNSTHAHPEPTMLTVPFGVTYEKIGTIQRRLAWPLHKDDTLSRSGRPTGLNIYCHLNSYTLFLLDRQAYCHLKVCILIKVGKIASTPVLKCLYNEHGC